MMADGGRQEVRSLCHGLPEREPNVIIIRQPHVTIWVLGDLLANLELVYLETLGGEVGDIELIEGHLAKGIWWKSASFMTGGMVL